MRRYGALLLAGVLAAGVLGACGDDDDDTSASTASTEEDAPSRSGSRTDVTAAVADDLFARMNREREARGKGPLTRDPALDQLAQEWSETMASTRVFEHRDLDTVFAHPDLSERIRSVSENIFTAPPGSENIGLSAHDGWMRSDGHRANILQGGSDIVGIGVVCGPDGTMWATELFAGLFDSTRTDDAEGPAFDRVVADEPDGRRCDGASAEMAPESEQTDAPAEGEVGTPAEEVAEESEAPPAEGEEVVEEEVVEEEVEEG